MFKNMTVRFTQTTSRLCLAVTKASANISVNVISRVTFNEYEKRKKNNLVMRNIINLDIHEVRRFLVCKDDEKKK